MMWQMSSRCPADVQQMWLPPLYLLCGQGSHSVPLCDAQLAAVCTGLHSGTSLIHAQGRHPSVFLAFLLPPPTAARASAATMRPRCWRPSAGLWRWAATSSRCALLVASRHTEQHVPRLSTHVNWAAQLCTKLASAHYVSSETENDPTLHQRRCGPLLGSRRGSASASTSTTVRPGAVSGVLL